MEILCGSPCLAADGEKGHPRPRLVDPYLLCWTATHKQRMGTPAVHHMQTHTCKHIHIHIHVQKSTQIHTHAPRSCSEREQASPQAITAGTLLSPCYQQLTARFTVGMQHMPDTRGMPYTQHPCSSAWALSAGMLFTFHAPHHLALVAGTDRHEPGPSLPPSLLPPDKSGPTACLIRARPPCTLTTDRPL